MYKVVTLLFPVIIGDGAVGKTCFVKKLLEASCYAAITDEGTATVEKADEYTPTIMDNYTFHYTRDGEQKDVR